MKKIFFFLIMIFCFLPVVTFAQTSALDNARTRALEEKMSQILRQELKEHMQLVLVSKKTVALEESHRAQQSLEVLAEAYPEAKEELERLIWFHRNLVTDGASPSSNKKLFYFGTAADLEFLYMEFKRLQKASPDAAAQAEKILNHLYWMDEMQEAMTLAAVQKEIACRLEKEPLIEGSRYNTFEFTSKEWIQSLH